MIMTKLHIITHAYKADKITKLRHVSQQRLSGYFFFGLFARTKTSRFDPWQPLPRYIYNLLPNSNISLYSRFSGFGLLCFLRDIFTTHHTDTCQHNSRDTTTILPDTAHTSAPCSGSRATEPQTSCQHRCALSVPLRSATPPFHITLEYNQLHEIFNLQYMPAAQLVNIYATFMEP